jgi:hypothetical protein
VRSPSGARTLRAFEPPLRPQTGRKASVQASCGWGRGETLRWAGQDCFWLDLRRATATFRGPLPAEPVCAGRPATATTLSRLLTPGTGWDLRILRSNQPPSRILTTCGSGEGRGYSATCRQVTSRRPLSFSGLVTASPANQLLRRAASAQLTRAPGQGSRSSDISARWPSRRSSIRSRRLHCARGRP